MSGIDDLAGVSQFRIGRTKNGIRDWNLARVDGGLSEKAKASRRFRFAAISFDVVDIRKGAGVYPDSGFARGEPESMRCFDIHQYTRAFCLPAALRSCQ